MSDVFFKRIKSDQLHKDPTIVCSFLDKLTPPLTFSPGDFIGVKMHFGEKGNKSYVHPKFLRPLIKRLQEQKTKPFLFDTNTLYRGKRMNSVDHINLASAHGFSALGVPIMIADGLRGGSCTEVVINKRHFNSCFIASLCQDIDTIFVISHLTAHMLAGFGAAIKNLAMGLSSRRGKLAQHCEILPTIAASKCTCCGACARQCPAQCIVSKQNTYEIQKNKCIGCAQCISVCPAGAVTINWSNEYTLLQERIVEYAYAASKDKRCVYMTFCLFITKECDCMNKETEGIVSDLGILASYDPVAIDRAAVELLQKREKKDIFKELHPDINYMHQFVYAEEIGLGCNTYTLIEI